MMCDGSTLPAYPIFVYLRNKKWEKAIYPVPLSIITTCDSIASQISFSKKQNLIAFI